MTLYFTCTIPTAFINSPQHLVNINAFDADSDGNIDSSTYCVLNSYGSLRTSTTATTTIRITWTRMATSTTTTTL